MSSDVGVSGTSGSVAGGCGSSCGNSSCTVVAGAGVSVVGGATHTGVGDVAGGDVPTVDELVVVSGSVVVVVEVVDVVGSGGCDVVVVDDVEVDVS